MEEEMRECGNCRFYEAAPFAYAQGCGICWKHTRGGLEKQTGWVSGVTVPCLYYERKVEQ